MSRDELACRVFLQLVPTLHPNTMDDAMCNHIAEKAYKLADAFNTRTMAEHERMEEVPDEPEEEEEEHGPKDD